ncbi:hypothetical protein GCM10022214_14300 [Actinomadura miaoliensis]|uniref:Uncharacterized protein n=1 Tax=Actinomadura miaoliensis TaxID=430685 RepID=A0ABP7V9J8_9ACTN
MYKPRPALPTTHDPTPDPTLIPLGNRPAHTPPASSPAKRDPHQDRPPPAPRHQRHNTPRHHPRAAPHHPCRQHGDQKTARPDPNVRRTPVKPPTAPFSVNSVREQGGAAGEWAVAAEDLRTRHLVPGTKASRAL